jgi:hypothetical protein
MVVNTTLFAVLVIEFLATSTDQEEPYKIKAKPNKARSGCQSRYLLNAWHHLGNSVKNPQSSQY